MSRLCFWLYRCLIAPLAVMLLLLLCPFAPANLKSAILAKKRQQFRFRQPHLKLDDLYWVHASSGEIEYAMPLIRELKKRKPHCQILVTYSSTSMLARIEKTQEIDIWGPAPWEFYFSVRKFLERFHPKACFIARTDAWPELCTQTQSQQIPIFLMAATFAQNSSRLRGFARQLTHHTLQKIQQIAVVSSQDEKTLHSTFPHLKNIAVLGDTRYDQVLYRLQNGAPLSPEFQKMLRADKLILVAGSTWPEDEAPLLKAFSQMRNQVQLVLVPHDPEPQHLQSLLRNCRDFQLSVSLSSQKNPQSVDVVVVDQVGVLASLYQVADLVFVGGSFRKQVHSVMEPLACGKPVLVGPHHLNNRECLEFQSLNLPELEQKAVAVVSNSTDLEKALQKFVRIKQSDPQKFQSAHSKIVEMLNSKAGATLRLLNNFQDTLKFPL